MYDLYNFWIPLAERFFAQKISKKETNFLTNEKIYYDSNRIIYDFMAIMIKDTLKMLKL